MSEQTEQRIECPVWHRSILTIVPDGVEVKCGSCHKQRHHISRERIEQAWKALTEQKALQTQSA